MGAEIKKIHPCVVVARDSLAKLPLTIIVPITEWDEKFSSALWHIRIEPTAENGLTKESSADTFQVRSVSKDRMVGKIGELSEDTMEKISSGLAVSLALVNPP